MSVEELRESQLILESSLEHPLANWLEQLNFGTIFEPTDPVLMTVLIAHRGIGLELGFALEECREHVNRKLNTVAQTIWVPTPLAGYTEYVVTNYNG